MINDEVIIIRTPTNLYEEIIDEPSALKHLLQPEYLDKMSKIISLVKRNNLQKTDQIKLKSQDAKFISSSHS